jgi:hypothetical protein
MLQLCTRAVSCDATALHVDDFESSQGDDCSVTACSYGVREWAHSSQLSVKDVYDAENETLTASVQVQESCAQPCSFGYASFADLVRTRVRHLMTLRGHLASIHWRIVRGNRAYEKHLTPQHGDAASAKSVRVIEPGLGNYLATFKSSSGKKESCTVLNGSSDALSVHIGLTPVDCFDTIVFVNELCMPDEHKIPVHILGTLAEQLSKYQQQQLKYDDLAYSMVYVFDCTANEELSGMHTQLSGGDEMYRSTITFDYQSLDEGQNFLGHRGSYKQPQHRSRSISAPHVHALHTCETAILTEGDSAFNCVLSSMSSDLRQTHSVIALCGMPKNLADSRTSNDSTLNDIHTLLELDCKEPRYRNILLVTDRDMHGMHMKGLLLLFFLQRAPHLLTGYVQDIIAPIITATLYGEQKSFFTMQEYQETSKTCGTVSAVKYNKGIASLTANEGKDHLFSSTRKHRILFAQSEEDSDALKRTFGGQSKSSCSIIGQTDELPPMKDDFFQNEYVRVADFAVQELGRSFVEQRRRRIISLLNALRQAQRNVLQGALWYTWDHTAKVKRLASYVAQSTRVSTVKTT